MLKVDLGGVLPFAAQHELDAMAGELSAAHRMLLEGGGRGSDFLGWVRLPRDIDPAVLAQVKAAAQKIQSDSRVLVVIGIGGSYLGARAVIEHLHSSDYNLKKKNTPDIFFAGNSLSPAALEEVIALIVDREFSVNVISKSGTTTEPAIAFRVFRKLLEDRYGKAQAARRIYATTDKARGALYTLACAEGYERFVIPDDVGGRFSVLTPVGLLPIAVSGTDIDTLLDGARDMMETCTQPSFDNPAWRYAAARNALYRQGKRIEALACYEPGFTFMAEWWKQLYGESEGKDQKGLFPAAVNLTADLHSMGQFLQDGPRTLIETVVTFEASAGASVVPADSADIDGLNFLSGVSLHEVNVNAFRGTMLAHVDGGLPTIVIQTGARDAYNLGQLLYFFEFACGLSGYLLGVNPFDQPGVEAYKKNMFALLGKPGYEEARQALRARIGI